MRCSNKFPIYLELGMGDKKPKAPFKYNLYWLEEGGFQEIVKSYWKHIDVHSEDSACIQFTNSLRLVKAKVVP